MRILLSPAKSLHLQFPKLKNKQTSVPEFWNETQVLSKILKQKSLAELEKLFSVSSKIAALNFDRYQKFPLEISNQNGFPALSCFDGAVYKPIETDNFSDSDWEFAQHFVRILSGLYGILKPLDLIFPYRLEMGTKLLNPGGKNLYEFWSKKVTEFLNQESSPIINLASQEYFSVVDTTQAKSPIIHVHFKEQKGGAFKIIAIYAKKARGAMTNAIIKNKISNPEDIKTIEILNYTFNKQLSDKDNFVFTRMAK